jgi:hypothetical protein
MEPTKIIRITDCCSGYHVDSISSIEIIVKTANELILKQEHKKYKLYYVLLGRQQVFAVLRLKYIYRLFNFITNK